MLLATAQNRVALFAIMFQEEKCRLMEAMLRAAAVAAFGMDDISWVTLSIVVLFRRERLGMMNWQSMIREEPK